MRKLIIYPQDNGRLVVVIPILDCGIPLEEIARKDVPAGKPYIIIDETDLPSDDTFCNAWEADFSNPDGYGIGAAAWFAEQTTNE
jgi:hypothetical protein